MYTKNIAALVGAIAAIEQASALSLHRHGHNLQKKAEVVEMVTVYETLYVTAGAPAPEPTVQANDGTVTSQVVAETPQPKFEAPVVKAYDPAPSSLVTSVKPAPTGSSSSSSSSSNNGPGFSGKRGLAYNDPVLANLFGKSCRKGACGWAYNWGDSAQNLDSAYSFVPTLWGNKLDFLSRWGSSCSKADGAKAVFSFNEPDNAGQAAMSPGAAADLHVKYMNSCSGKALVGAPSVSNSNLAGEGLQWLTEFVSQCEGKGCKYDFCNVHWYSPASAFDDLFAHLEKAHKICGGKPVWLTEFAPLGSASEIDAFMTKAMPKLDALDYLHGYSYFMVKPDSLLSSATSLSSLGNIYASA